ncbi:lysylphosphatidylglycerol synthase domain-containing protein [Siccirubricoccus phaeus]|uniref:lysylphosphatidylglycerol synthase domain-containing protein n=1 Tax=Siccirubricoccus phaeus TaxID=2595053 RepID=UPI0011F1052E|nr:phosphatidylglycerol lysyltransferase domain-containing protein [Siccirubricoccus phaeus]
MTGALGWLRRHGAAVFGLLLLVGALYVVQREFSSLSVADIRRAMAAIPARAIWLAGGCTILAYLVLAIYDKLGSVYAGRSVSWTKSFLASFCGYSLAHNLGFAAVSGAAVRYRLYSAWGLTPLEIAKVVGFTSLTFGLGGMALGGLVLVLEPEVVPWFGTHLPHWALQALAIPLWGVVLTYVVLSRFFRHVRIFRHEIELPRPRMALAQALLATVDVAVTAGIFYILLPEAEGLTFIRFVGIYLAAYAAGILAHVPGGIGVFDGAILLGLQPYLPAPEVIGALFVFRLYYYILPLFIAGALFVGFEIGQRRAMLQRLTAIGTGTDALEVPALASLVALAGALLIFLGALPTRGTIIELWAGHVAALVSHFAASIVGSLLLVMAFGLLRRLTIAWSLTLILLLNGAAIAWVRGEEWWLWGPFLLLTALLASLRSAFYRDSRLIREPLSAETLVPLLAVAVCGITLALVAYGGRVSNESWWQVVFSRLAPDSLRFTVGLTGVLLLAGMVRLLRPARIAPLPWGAAMRTRLTELGALAPAEADGAVFGENGRAGFAFLKRDGVWLALGDPAGERADAISAIWRFRDLCERAGVDPAFWRIGDGLLRVYGDIGLTTVRLAEQPPLYLALKAERDLATLLPLLPPEMQREAKLQKAPAE